MLRTNFDILVKVLIAAIDAGVNSNDSGVKDNAKKLSSFGINDSKCRVFIVQL